MQPVAGRGEPSQVTRLLQEWRGGRREALDDLTPILYRELRRLASAYLRRERAAHSLQPTALVNEAYLRLVGAEPPECENRGHFMAIAARSMRQVLVDFARRKRASKRDFGKQVTLDEHIPGKASRHVEVLALNDALERLAEIDARKARVIELRYFGGLSLEETAAAMGLTVATVRRDAALAQTLLRDAMSASSAGA